MNAGVAENLNRVGIYLNSKASRLQQAIFTMKRKLTFAAFAIMVFTAGAVLFSAFRAGNSSINARTESYLWMFNGGDSLSAANYTKVSSATCSGSQKLCAIEAPESSNPNQPLMSNTLKQRITDHDESLGDVSLKD